MFCHKCGKEIDAEAVVCVHCGVETKNLKSKETPINIVNQNANTSSARNRVRRNYNGFVDFMMVLLTGGLWFIWMIFRPKYED